MTKFKVGDKARIVDCWIDDTDYREGQIIQIAWVDSTDDARFKDSSGHFWRANQLEAIKPSRPPKEKAVEYVVIYDLVDRDPAKTFTSRQELNKWLKEAVDDRNVVFDSIRVYKVTKTLIPKVSKKVSLRSK